MIGVVVSRADEASVHIGEHLRNLADWTAREDAATPDGDGGGTVYRTEGFELREFDGLHIELEGVAEPFDDPSLIVFVSRHSGETGPLLTVHFTGNVGPAEFGGEDRTLARAAPNTLAALLGGFRVHAPTGYAVGMEATHHGPTDLDVPSLFAELGSGPEQWGDAEAAQAVAQTVLDCRGVDPDRDRQLVGFGGGHYAPRFERIVRETDWAVGHVAADWGLESPGALGGDVIDAVFERSATDLAVIDGDRPALAGRIEDRGYRVVTETWVREVERVPLEIVERLETAVRSIDDGLRVGEPARDADPDVPLVTVAPGQDLLDAVNGVDVARSRSILARTALAFETAEGGSCPDGRLALPDEEAYETVLDAWCTLLEGAYEAVERTGGEVVVREHAFDPAAARDLGVPEGPDFGRLAAGESVCVDGETVPPDAVHRERFHRFPTRS